MDAVCVQLDDTVLQIFQVLEDLFAEQEKLEQLMKDGFFGMSRSRYLLGVKWISADQILDADIVAKYTTVVHSVTKEGATLTEPDEPARTTDVDKLTVFQLSDAVADVYIDENEEPSDVLLGAGTDKQEGLRKRHTDNDESKQKNLPEDTAKKDAVPSKEVDVVTPVKTLKKDGAYKALTLFGVLTPQPLRTSQKCFEEAVKVAVHLADLKWKLNYLQGEYRRLRKVKENLADEQ